MRSHKITGEFYGCGQLPQAENFPSSRWESNPQSCFKNYTARPKFERNEAEESKEEGREVVKWELGFAFLDWENGIYCTGI